MPTQSELLMPSAVDYEEAIRFLYGMRLFGTKLGLRNTLRLADLAGNPHRSLRFIHVAGTNGKGSACAMLESICRHAGLRAGLFTSPHLIHFSERLQVNRQPIAETDIIRLVTWIKALLQEFPPDEHPTFFEIITVMALRYFNEQRCDIVIWETGLGGRFDATNIVVPLASVITNIQFDHMAWLGDSLAKIAYEKAGIIKPGIPIITAAESSEALAVLESVAAEQKAPLYRVSEADTYLPPLDTIELPLLGRHQRLNAALAIRALRAVPLEISESAIRRGLEDLLWPGRLQLIKRRNGKLALLDGAHNPAGALTLAAAVRQFFPRQDCALILGIMIDKDWRGICQILAPLANHIYVTSVSSERTALPQDLLPACQAANPNAKVEICPSLKQALDHAANEQFMIVTGSLHLVGEALDRLARGDFSSFDERLLNEAMPKG